MKRVKRWAVVVMAAMMLTGCGEKKTVTYQWPENREEQGSTGQNASQGGAGGLWNGQSTEITSYEELEAYQADRMEDIIAAYTDSGIEYEITPNHCYLYGTEQKYEILEREYEIVQIAYSLYNYEQNQLNTVIDFEYEFHPEKGLTSDDKYIQLLSALIHTTENEELKEKFSTSDALVSEISGCVGSGQDCVVFEAPNCRMKIEVDGSAKYILGFVNIDNTICNIPRVDPVYKEFASLDEYKAYVETDIRQWIDESKYNVWTGDDTSFSLVKIGEEEEFVYVCVSSTLTAYGVDNNFARLCRGNLYPWVDKEYMQDARDVIEQVFEHLDIPDLDIEKAVDEVMSYDIVQEQRFEYSLSYEWFGMNPVVDQYPFMQRGSVVIPIKVEGMLNR